MIDELVKNVQYEAAIINEKGGVGIEDFVVTDLHFYLIYYATIMKDKAFHEEKEWRLIGPDSDYRLDYRPGRYSIIPYIKVPLLFNEVSSESRSGASMSYIDMNISKIYVGPTINPSLSRSAFTSFITTRQKTGIGPIGVKIVNSKILFRNW